MIFIIGFFSISILRDAKREKVEKERERQRGKHRRQIDSRVESQTDGQKKRDSLIEGEGDRPVLN